MKTWTKETVIARAKEIGEKYAGTLTCAQLRDEGRVPVLVMSRLFPRGGFPELRHAAGLKKPVDPRTVTDESIMEEFHRAAGLLGGVPTLAQACRLTGRSPILMRRRLGGPGEVRARYGAWLRKRGLSLPRTSAAWEPPGRRSRAWRDGRAGALSGGSGGSRWVRHYGDPIEVRGLRYAPVNEMGVVALFGALAAELGFLIEAVRVEFPDCEAKRLVDARQGRWEAVRIEFEFRSSGFRQHGHDAKKVDLIVCWENDWAGCPVEVIELKREVERLKAAARGDAGRVAAEESAGEAGDGPARGCVRGSRRRTCSGSR